MVCEICKKEIRSQSKNDLKHHMKLYHEGDKNYPCTLCEAHFNSDHHLANHLQKIHTRQESNSFKKCLCKPCNLYFDLPSRLRVHERSQKHKYQAMFYKNHNDPSLNENSATNKQKEHFEAENDQETFDEVQQAINANAAHISEDYVSVQDFISKQSV